MRPEPVPQSRERCPQIALRAALLRVLIARRMGRMGRWLGNPFRRLILTLAASRPRPHPRPDQPVSLRQKRMPSVGSFRACLGLGLAGGGGGSPGHVSHRILA